MALLTTTPQLVSLRATTSLDAPYGLDTLYTTWRARRISDGVIFDWVEATSIAIGPTQTQDWWDDIFNPSAAAIAAAAGGDAATVNPVVLE